MNNINLLAFVLLTFLAAATGGCRAKKIQHYNYFSVDARDSSHSRVFTSEPLKIHPGDKITILVSALNPESAKPYNLSFGAAAANQGITVEPDGTIVYPQLGRIQVAGLTREQLRDTLVSRLKSFVVDPVVIVEFTSSKKITFLGEVNRQGPVMLREERLTILEAIGEAGDLKPNARRDSVLVIRESNGRREFGTVNLLSNDVFKSPYFILQQNDVVYVPSEKPIREEKGFLDRATGVITILTSLTSLIWIIYSISR